MDVEVRFKDGVANKRVKRKWVRTDDVAEVGVADVEGEATVEPEFDQGHHGVGFASFGNEASHQVRTLTPRMTMRRNKRSDGGAVEGGDEDLDVLGVCLNMSLG